LKLALQNGLAREGLIEAITHLVFYCGWPRVAAALPITRRVSEEAVQ